MSLLINVIDDDGNWDLSLITQKILDSINDCSLGYRLIRKNNTVILTGLCHATEYASADYFARMVFDGYLVSEEKCSICQRTLPTGKCAHCYRDAMITPITIYSNYKIITRDCFLIVKELEHTFVCRKEILNISSALYKSDHLPITLENLPCYNLDKYGDDGLYDICSCRKVINVIIRDNFTRYLLIRDWIATELNYDVVYYIIITMVTI